MATGRIQFLGTGNAFNHDGRGSQALLIEPPDGVAFLVDVGPTAPAAMQAQGIDPRSQDKLFVTHLHGDHVAGWPFLLLHLAIPAGRQRPFDIHGPQGTRDCLRGLERLCYPDVLAGCDFSVRYHELEIADRDGVDGSDGLRFDTRPMDHHATSLGYRFHLGSVTIGVTGDTRWCDGLETLASGSDILVLECSSVEPLQAAHVSLSDLRRRRARLGTARVLLVHLNDQVATELDRHPIDGVLATRDGMKISF